MTATTYHLLTEAEPFSEFLGGAISRWAGNALRDAPDTVVVCPSADGTWAFAAEAVRVLPRLRLYKKFLRSSYCLPWLARDQWIQWVFASIIAQLQPGDVVWIHNRPEFALALSSVVRRAGARIVLHMHNAHFGEGPEALMRRIEVDRLVFASRFLLEQALGRFPSLGASSVLYSGADQSIFYPPTIERQSVARPTVLFAGRLVANKGVHVLLDAMKLLEHEGVSLQAHIVGSSNFGLAEETAYIRDLKASSPSSVTFLPYRSGVALGDLFREADIFCSPAVWDEPFGLVNVEALASALPVVTSSSGGAKEIFSTGGGILVERGSATHLAAALRRLAEDPTYRADLGRQGYAAFLERFTWSKARVQLQQIYNYL